MDDKRNDRDGINIYLAGKVSANDWRHTLVKELRDVCCEFGTNGLPDQWPVIKNGITKNMHYVGPYFIGCDHGCYHGKDSHGYGPGCGCDIIEYPKTTYDNHCPDAAREEYVVNQCRDAIERSDIVFAWIDDLTAFATIFELGIAIGNKKRVFLASPNDDMPLLNKMSLFDTCGEQYTQSTNNLWFIFKCIELESGCLHIYADEPIDAFNQVLNILNEELIEKEKRSKLESPIEKRFFDACIDYQYGSELVPQYEIIAENHHYRADFAIPSRMVVIELDGHEYHKTKEQRTKDARRERDLQTAGWRVIRFTGTEIHSDVYKCIREARNFIEAVSK